VHIATCYTSKTWIGPKIAIEKSAPARALVGEQFTYDIAVSNPSDVAATNVVVTDVLPDGIAYVSSTPSASVQGQSLSWSLGSLAARDTSQISVQVKGTRTGTFENCAEVNADFNLSDRACATTVIVAPALALDKECSAEIIICDPIDYTITVRNTGDGPATNVRISDRLPSGVTTTDGRSSIEENIGTLEAGQSHQIRFQAKADKTGQFENTATATADGGLTAEASCTTVVRQPVLAVDKTAPELRYIGRSAVYEITVSNTGDIAARETVLVDTVPDGTEFIQASDGGRFASGQVTWQLGTLEAGASRKVTVTVKALRRGVVRNTATARAICAEATDDASMEIKGVPAILLEVIDVEDPIEIGGSVTYVITVTNQGSAEGTNIVIECTVPPEEDHMSSTGPTTAAVDGKTVKFAPLAMLAPQAKATYRVVVKGTEVGDVRFRVKLTSDQMDSPVEETESTHVY
jgi:uncharacterized repeat protein (TIGR01451 family)